MFQTDKDKFYQGLGDFTLYEFGVKQPSFLENYIKYSAPLIKSPCFLFPAQDLCCDKKLGLDWENL